MQLSPRGEQVSTFLHQVVDVKDVRNAPALQIACEPVDLFGAARVMCDDFVDVFLAKPDQPRRSRA